MISGSGTFRIEYHLLHIGGPYHGEYVYQPGESSIVAPQPDGGAFIKACTALGNVKLSWRCAPDGDELPLAPDLWEDIAQVVVTPVDGQLMIRNIAEGGDSTDNIALSPSAPHVIRVAGRGRDAAWEATVSGEPVEEFLVDLWLAAPEDAAEVVKQTSRMIPAAEQMDP